VNWWFGWRRVLDDEFMAEIAWLDAHFRKYAPDSCGKEERKRPRHYYRDLFYMFHGHDWKDDASYGA